MRPPPWDQEISRLVERPTRGRSTRAGARRRACPAPATVAKQAPTALTMGAAGIQSPRAQLARGGVVQISPRPRNRGAASATASTGQGSARTRAGERRAREGSRSRRARGARDAPRPSPRGGSCLDALSQEREDHPRPRARACRAARSRRGPRRDGGGSIHRRRDPFVTSKRSTTPGENRIPAVFPGITRHLGDRGARRRVPGIRPEGPIGRGASIPSPGGSTASPRLVSGRPA